MSERKEVSISCGGHCCNRFYFDLSPEELTKNRDAINSDKQVFRRDNGRFKSVIVSAELLYIENMLVFIEKSSISASTGKDTGSLGNYYTCKHLGENGLCMDYDNRPKMCSEYPYGKKCKYTNCCK